MWGSCQHGLTSPAIPKVQFWAESCLNFANAAGGRALAPVTSSGSFDAASREAVRQKKLKTAPSHGWASGLAWCHLIHGWQAVVSLSTSCQAVPASLWEAQGPPQQSALPLKQPVQVQSRIDRAPASAQAASLLWQVPLQPVVPPCSASSANLQLCKSFLPCCRYRASQSFHMAQPLPSETADQRRARRLRTTEFANPADTSKYVPTRSGMAGR